MIHMREEGVVGGEPGSTGHDETHKAVRKTER